MSRLWVTASGGPFRGRTRDELTGIRPEDALKHPTWHMGAKITIDSSTLMNKGLEVIEAHHLFAMPYDKIEVVVQPQSAIHSMVEFSDGSVKAHLGTTDMRIPIQYALSFPERWDAPVEPLDFRTLGSLEFASPDTGTFRCLALAREAGGRGGTLPCAMNNHRRLQCGALHRGMRRVGHGRACGRRLRRRGACRVARAARSRRRVGARNGTRVGGCALGTARCSCELRRTCRIAASEKGLFHDR